MSPEWLGRVPYREALARQRARRDAIVAGTAPEAFWLLEHDPVVTTGRREVPGLDASCGLEVVKTERGGLATWHGPGQLVGYLLIDVARRGLTVKGTVAAVEAGVIAWLAGEGIVAARRGGYPGVWVGTDKICALGLHFRRGVSMHGFGLNLTADLSDFGRITPCGITDGGVTSMAKLRENAPDPAEAARPVAEHVLAALARGA